MTSGARSTLHSRSPRVTRLSGLARLTGVFVAFWFGCGSHSQAADLTGFLQGGWPGARSGIGLSLGLPVITEMLVVEAEYSNAGSTLDASAFRSFAGNVRFTLPSEIGRFQPYFVLGLGVYRQDSGGGTSIAASEGAGSFIRLMGPLAARVDVRFFQLRNAPEQGRQRRVYIGASFRF